ncbi:hypothetical protein [Streptomyces galilaeus]|uniref:hypothetical protein n=1 Tax=Streptomyces galilaeus TaxID=33899 RepID=UPI0038F5F14D
MELDTRNGQHVVGHSVLKADLGVGGRSLIVISGIALPEWRIDSDETHRLDCRLMLREPAGMIEQSAVHVGLASIGNGDSEWVFATDQARLAVEAEELVLIINLAVMGEPSSLNRFSYQIVLTHRMVVSEITGTISWPTAWLRPTAPTPAGVSGVFSLRANELTTTPASGPLGGTVEHLLPLTPGEIVSVVIGEETCLATYRIAEPPLGRNLKVTVAARKPNGAGETMLDPVAANGDLMTLSVAQPTRTNVDFILSSDSIA